MVGAYAIYIPEGTNDGIDAKTETKTGREIFAGINIERILPGFTGVKYCQQG